LSPGRAGVAVEVGGRRFFLPVERLAFVAPIRVTEGDDLVLARGRLPLLRLAGRMGLSVRSEERSAIGIDGRRGFYAVAAEDVRWVEDADSADLEPLDPDLLWTPEEEQKLFPGLSDGV
jgi:hypothetical protein